MAAAKKATDTTNKSIDTAAKEEKLKVAPISGFEVFEKGDGSKGYRWILKGNEISDGAIFVESREEASALACLPFQPSGSHDFSAKTKAEFEEYHSRIFDSVINIDNTALKVAFDLHWINSKQAYKIKNFPTIVDYAKFYFGYEKTSCYSLIAVVDRFAKRDEDGNILEEIDDAYSAYSSSKLALMVNLTDDQINASLKPAMSVRDIKKIVKAIEDSSLPDHSKDSGDKKEDNGDETKPPEQSGTDTGKDTFVDSKEIIRNTLFTFKGVKDYGRKFNADKVNDQVSSILKDHPDALIEISYILP
ncbi:MAG: hypothetical protein HDR04_13755 [Lachnospiraceae bacterium]|nr:hypothetical protein [Lachnospiraceae bacterium]